MKNLYVLSLLLLVELVYISLQKKRNELWSRTSALFKISVLIILFQVVFNTSLPIVERLKDGIYAALRITDLSLLVFIFVSITSISQIVSFFSFLPAKIRLAITITFSLIPVIMNETEKIKLVQSARGHKPHILKPWQNLFPILIPLLHRSLNRAEQITQVMLARGFNE